MNQIELVNEYIEKNFSHFNKIKDNLWSFKENGVDTFVCIVKEKELEDKCVLFDKDFKLILDKEEVDLNAKYYAFNFGGNFYYIENKDLEKTKLHIFRYLGNYEVSNENFAHLGIHSTYSLLFGCQKIESYIEKAKYLGIKYLGICEKQTLNSSLKFQNSCLENGIKPIIGEEIRVKYKDDFYWYKLFVKNNQGWKNLINVSNIINAINKSEGNLYIEEEDLREILKEKNLFCILPNNFPFKNLIKKYKNINCYYQIDTVEWLDKDYYFDYLSNIKNYLYEYSEEVEPILISDSFYLDEEDQYLQDIAIKIGNKKEFQYASKSQHFKSIDEQIEIFSKFWKGKEDIFEGFMEVSINNTVKLAKECNFEIKFEKLHIPMARISKKDWDAVIEEENSYKN